MTALEILKSKIHASNQVQDDTKGRLAYMLDNKLILMPKNCRVL